MIDRRRFLKWAAASAAAIPAGIFRATGVLESESAPTGSQTPAGLADRAKASSSRSYAPRRIPNEYSLLLPGEAEALEHAPSIADIESDSVFASGSSKNVSQRRLRVGDELDGWCLVALLPRLNGIPTAVFEKHVTHRGVIVYVTESGEIERIPKGIGELSHIRPRPINADPGKQFFRHATFPPQPDAPGDYILNSNEDPCYENVAALGAELIGWTLVANEEAGPEKSLWLEADGKSRQLAADPQTPWAPDLTGRLFDPARLLPSEYLYDYVPGYSKRTLLGGYLPVADIGVWNPNFKVGYEVIVLLPPGTDTKPIGRVRALLPEDKNSLIPEGDTSASQKLPSSRWVDRYWNGSAEDFFSALAGIWNHWRHFFEDRMRVEIPDPWLLDAARAGIVLSRCSYHGLEPTYQIGEGAYTKIPVRSHALFPVAHYEFVWAHQLWNLTNEVEPYFEHYLDHYILSDGNFLYNTQDQVEAPLNAGIFLENSARAYDYSGNLDAFQRRLPVLRRMIDFVLKRYRYSLDNFPESDPRYGLIWGSPEADLGDPQNDYPASHPWFYQNAVWIWRGLYEHQRALARAAKEATAKGSPQLSQDLERESAELQKLASEMRAKIERSLKLTLDARNPEMMKAGITPFHPFDTTRKPDGLSSYENHRFMMDWWTADWGDSELDEGHFLHRTLAGEQLMGMNTDGHYPRTSNFMEHGTLASRIRQKDYRPFLLALYGNLCYAMDSGSRYAPEDALLPGNYPGEGSPYAWSAVVNSELQPTLALRWLLCYEEHDRAGELATVHLQKAAPMHWFADGQRIVVEECPTRFGKLSWRTESSGGLWRIEITLPANFGADLMIYVHPPSGQPLRTASMGQREENAVRLTAAALSGRRQVSVEIR
ncbi:MAG TPA: hypothetical protein VGT03_03415 [Candidatus Acidoferrales bacterium]|nr:hypothetical protein [Candidatus Acidoferrales bacterium]